MCDVEVQREMMEIPVQEIEIDHAEHGMDKEMMKANVSHGDRSGQPLPVFMWGVMFFAMIASIPLIRKYRKDESLSAGEEEVI